VGSTKTLATVGSMQILAVCSADGSQITFELNDSGSTASMLATVGGNHTVVVNASNPGTPAVLETVGQDRINFDGFDQRGSTMDGQLAGEAFGTGCAALSAVTISGNGASSKASASKSTAGHLPLFGRASTVKR
jgi:hypothetical protein